jgi:hypothetical protein
MTTISLSPKLVTLINVFTVEPANQQQLLELLALATETSVRHAPGFISSSLHRGLDGTKVTMYAQWRSVEDYQGPASLFTLGTGCRRSVRDQLYVCFFVVLAAPQSEPGLTRSG